MLLAENDLHDVFDGWNDIVAEVCAETSMLFTEPCFDKNGGCADGTTELDVGSIVANHE